MSASAGRCESACAARRPDITAASTQPELKHARRLIDDPGVRVKLAEIYSRLEAVRLLATRNFWMVYSGTKRSYEGSQTSYMRKTTNLWLTKALLDLLGPEAMSTDPLRGAMAGLLKGGIGSASIDLGGGLIVGALVAVNSVGSALMPDGATYWAWPFELNGEFGSSKAPGAQADMGNPAPDETRLLAQDRMRPGANTTLGVVAGSAALTTAECTRVAMMAQDGIARALLESAPGATA